MIRNLIFTLLILLSTGSAFAAQYIKAEVFKNALEQKKDMFIVDIQEADDFDEHHFAGSLETNAYLLSARTSITE